jgi:hypothetical protein
MKTNDTMRFLPGKPFRFYLVENQLKSLEKKIRYEVLDDIASKNSI